jgi:hypothetical protein
MSLSNTKFHPSRVEDRIYDLMLEEEGHVIGIDIYAESLFLAIYNMMANEFPEVEWETFATPTMRPGISLQSFAWIENGHIHLIGWYFEEKEMDW